MVIAPEAVDTVLLPIAQRLGRMADDPASIRDSYEQRLASYRERVADLEDSLRATQEQMAAMREELDRYRLMAQANAPVANAPVASAPVASAPVASAPVATPAQEPDPDLIDTAPGVIEGGRRPSIPVATPYASPLVATEPTNEEAKAKTRRTGAPLPPEIISASAQRATLDAIIPQSQVLSSARAAETALPTIEELLTEPHLFEPEAANAPVIQHVLAKKARAAARAAETVVPPTRENQAIEPQFAEAVLLEPTPPVAAAAIAPSMPAPQPAPPSPPQAQREPFFSPPEPPPLPAPYMAPSYTPAAASVLAAYDEPSLEAPAPVVESYPIDRLDGPSQPRESWTEWQEAWGNSSLRRWTLEFSEIQSLGWLPALMFKIERMLGFKAQTSHPSHDAHVATVSPSWLTRLFHLAVPAGVAAAIVACGTMLIHHHSKSSDWKELDSAIASASSSYLDDHR